MHSLSNHILLCIVCYRFVQINLCAQIDVFRGKLCFQNYMYLDWYSWVLLVLVLYCTLLNQRSTIFNPFTPDSTKSKTDNVSEITNWVKFKNEQQNSKV